MHPICTLCVPYIACTTPYIHHISPYGPHVLPRAHLAQIVTSEDLSDHTLNMNNGVSRCSNNGLFIPPSRHPTPIHGATTIHYGCIWGGAILVGIWRGAKRAHIGPTPDGALKHPKYHYLGVPYEYPVWTPNTLNTGYCPN